MGTIGDVARLSALSAWRMTRSVYRFDPALYASLLETPVSGKLPVEVLFQLPEWCVYIETPGFLWSGEKLAGFFAHLEYDVNMHRAELRLLLDLGSASWDHLIGIPLHLLENSTLEDAVSSAMQTAREYAAQNNSNLLEAIPEDVPQQINSSIEPLISLLLYLCSTNAEISGQGVPGNPKPVKTRRGMKVFPATAPRIWDVGVRIGSALRRAEQAGDKSNSAGTGSGAKKRPHVRRAHWHTYLVGKGRVNRVLKWIPPVPVGVSDDRDLPTVIKPVK
ncbi:hypothetical protein GF1_16710 [Desulfolithobacter dissulfuricans]|uniref:Uncharacterized protein n=1 Tax=Desulfolithobacter dissulfuricans TaxID=2795293 RepID=A0A915XIL3_9BACT|nr:hypothetical protein GF1_16710 [Desulfolithobacter dissulfuricans]